MNAPGETLDHAYLLDATAPLVFGTGKPLDFGLGGDSLPFPFPSTVAGAVRAAAEARAGRVADPHANRGTVCLGPTLLARMAADGILRDVLLPRPADAVYIGGHIVPLQPVDPPVGAWTDLEPGLKLLQLSQADGVQLKAKPDQSPAWWTCADYERWLANARVYEAADLAGDAESFPKWFEPGAGVVFPKWFEPER